MFKALVAAVIIAESGGDPSALSPKDAKGIMQVTDIGVEEVRQQYWCMRFIEWRPYNREINQMFGELLLKFYLQKADGNVREALVLYNSGYAGLEKWREGKPYKETEDYVKKVCGLYGKCLKPLKPVITACQFWPIPRGGKF